MGCDTCGKKFSVGRFQCKYCGGDFCTSHRLPESHSCPQIDEAVAPPFFTGAAESSSSRSDVDTQTKELREKWWREEREELPYESIDPETLGTAPEDFGDPSPDVAVDGSIKRDESQPETNTEVESDGYGLVGWILAFAIFIALLGGSYLLVTGSLV